MAFAAVLASVALGVADARAAGLDDATYESQSVPLTLFCGQTADVTVRMRNTGTTTWLRNTYRLRSVGSPWGVDMVAPPANVGAGSSTTFGFRITAPSASAEAVFQWRMTNGVVDFGAPTPPVTVRVVCRGDRGYQSGYRELGGTVLSDLFHDNAHLVEDTAFSSTLYSHIETSTVFFGGRYWMYHRHPRLDVKGVAVATSLNGHVWEPYAGGARIFGDVSISSPNVMVDTDAAGRPRLTMVFECDSACGSPGRVAVGRSYSYDGTTWSAPQTVVAPSGSGYDGVHTGTPNVVRTPDGRYRVGYHTHPSTGTGDFEFLKVAFADGTSLDSRLPRPTAPHVGNGTANPAGWWARAGVGKRDIVKEGAYWYMVVEGFRGDVNCPLASNITSWALARTLDSTFRTGWQFSPLSPARIDREGHKCGEDMPSIQVVEGVPYVVTTGMLQLTGAGDGGADALTPLKRYRVVPGPRGKINTHVVAMARTSDGGGYYEVTAAGHVFAYGNATFHGSAYPSASPVVGVAAKPGGGGYWLVTANGVVRHFGSAGFHEDPYPTPLVAPITGIAATPSGNGYWLVARDGGVFAYGDAPFHGSMGGKPLNAPMVGIAATTSGNGYWLVGSDGGVFNYGDAPFHGSMGGKPLNAPVVGIAGAPNNGYWMVGRDGGVFAFPNGNPYAGSTLGLLAEMPDSTPTARHWADAVAIVSTPASVGYGYWILFKDGGVLDLGPARYHGDPVFG